MVAEENPLVRGMEVVPIVELVGGGAARVIEAQDARGQERGIVTVTDGKNGERPEHPPRRVHQRFVSTS
jgi:hypothetical protein